jgi:hypothetical protein
VTSVNARGEVGASGFSPNPAARSGEFARPLDICTARVVENGEKPTDSPDSGESAVTPLVDKMADRILSPAFGRLLAYTIILKQIGRIGVIREMRCGP